MGFSTLEIGKSALLAQRYGLEVVSNNISNANTEGYSRKRADLTSSTSKFEAGNFVGTGVIADQLKSFREEFFDKEIRNSITRNAGYEADQEILKRIEGVLGEPSETGLNNLISDFFISWDELASNPDKSAYRQKVISSARNMTDKFHQLAEGFEEARIDTLSKLNENVKEVNSLARRIAEINSRIADNHYSALEGDLNMADEREVLIEKLAEFGKMNVSQNEDGTVNVYMNGINLVTGKSINELKLVETTNGTTNERTVGVYTTDKQGNILNKINPGAGKLESQMKHYNETLDKDDTSGNFSIAKSINELAKEIAANVNMASVSGFGLNDTGATPPGRSFFVPYPADADALSIQVNTVILNDSDNIPLSSVAGESGNNQIGLQIASLADDINFINNRTPGEYYSDLLSKAGNMLNDSQTGLKNSTMVLDQMKNQRDTIIGVNLDEEAVNLIKFQRSFEAASRVVNMADEVLGTIVNLGR
ncbi:MAG: flagellar hook-associated protein FlgK [Ignavibacteriae bacterium]|nr:flagellar hook-associated protein FlgK [Ignavibacteriota bacterium]MCB9221466.1 flagellar hook-associated protein FlgK [Ignavibacteria bacterium]